MKASNGFSLRSAGVILILVLTVFSMGCTHPSTQSTSATTAPTTGTGSKAPLQVAAGSMIPATLPYGVTISYPKDWERQDVLTSGVRDYGLNTINIANFYSPNEIPGDTSSYNSLSIDLDQYFNHATLAIGKTYGTQMEAHAYMIKIAGYDSYELDFNTVDVKGTYIFTKTDGGIYIFAFKGPTKPVAVSALAGEIVDMYKSIQLNPPVPTVVKQR